eukprot:12645210-Ditylum_brightwellii.AAC.1
MVMFSRPIQQTLSGKDWKAISWGSQSWTATHCQCFCMIQRNKNEGLEEAVLALRKEDRVLIAKRVERKRYRSTIRRIREERYGREWDGEDNDGKEYGSRKKARRTGSFRKVDETEIIPQ